MMKSSLPGPFTFILKANNSVSKIFQTNKKEVGIITSGGMSPCLNKGIALAFIDFDFRKEEEFLIGIRDNFFIFNKTKLPFYKDGSYLK